jgi:hypothetical protein
MTDAQPRDAGGSGSEFGCEICPSGPSGLLGRSVYCCLQERQLEMPSDMMFAGLPGESDQSSVTLEEGVTGRTRVSYYSPLL